jgi:hypothetical protein
MNPLYLAGGIVALAVGYSFYSRSGKGKMQLPPPPKVGAGAAAGSQGDNTSGGPQPKGSPANPSKVPGLGAGNPQTGPAGNGPADLALGLIGMGLKAANSYQSPGSVGPGQYGSAGYSQDNAFFSPPADSTDPNSLVSDPSGFDGDPLTGLPSDGGVADYSDLADSLA